MPLQAFVDESETFAKGSQKRHFVMAALVGHSEQWANFSDEWRSCLRTAPAINYFKMSEAAALSGQFYRMGGAKRDQKLIELAQTINKYARLVTWSVFDLDAFDEIKKGAGPRSTNNYYFWPFHNTINAVCFALWDAGWRELFEIIFDEQVIFGPRAKRWYPVVRDIVRVKHPGEASILPLEPLFRNDLESLPLQAADLFAWCIRNATDNYPQSQFEWLLQYFKDLSTTEYSQYYDRERLMNIQKLTLELLTNEDATARYIYKRYSELFRGR